MFVWNVRVQLLGPDLRSQLMIVWEALQRATTALEELTRSAAALKVTGGWVLRRQWHSA